MRLGGHVARTAAVWLPRGAWAVAIGGALLAVHRTRWGFDLTSPAQWRHAWTAFASGLLVIDTLDEAVQWGSLPTAAAVAVLGADPAVARARRLLVWLRRPVRDDTPLDSDYDPAVITAPLPGARAAAPRIELPTVKALNMDDQAIVDEADAEIRRATQALDGAVDHHYAPAAPPPAASAQPPGPTTPAAAEGGAGAAGTAPPPMEIDTPDDQAVLHLYGILAQLGWAAAMLRGVPVKSALRPDDRVDLLLAGDNRIYPLVLVAPPPGAVALPFEARGVWQLERGQQRWEVPSPVVRAITLANAVDEALQRAGVFDGPFVVPCVVVTSGVLRADREHDALWDAHDVVLMSEPPGRVTATGRTRTLANVLGADRPSGAVLGQLREALHA